MRLFLSVGCMLLIIMAPIAVVAQCIEGNCVNGIGTANFENGDRYVGQWKDGVRSGQGTYFLRNGDKFIGQFKDDKADGTGILIDHDGVEIRGQWQDGKFVGKGVLTRPDGKVKTVRARRQ
ncbi:MAG: hypothetical protein HQL06_11250 [Nitrospirae bacterium]|nr:hypothetical protein [Nitrospirota bacterium]